MAVSLYTVATQGRYGIVQHRYTVATTQGRYDKLVAPIIIDIDVKIPKLMFSMKFPYLRFEVKKPTIKLVVK